MIIACLKLIILVPIAVLLIFLSVANRHIVTLALNPFQPDDAVMSLSLPLFIFLFAALIVGLLLGLSPPGSPRASIASAPRRTRSRKWRDEAGKQRTRSRRSPPATCSPSS